MHKTLFTDYMFMPSRVHQFFFFLRILATKFLDSLSSGTASLGRRRSRRITERISAASDLRVGGGKIELFQNFSEDGKSQNQCAGDGSPK
jgi:hypothetical protein